MGPKSASRNGGSWSTAGTPGFWFEEGTSEAETGEGAAELEEEPAHSQGLVDEEAAILEPMETKAEVEGSAEEEEMAAAMPVGDEAEGYESEEPSEEPMEEEGEESDEAEARKKRRFYPFVAGSSGIHTICYQRSSGIQTICYQRNRLPRNRKGGKIGSRTRWSKERGGV